MQVQMTEEKTINNEQYKACLMFLDTGSVIVAFEVKRHKAGGAFNWATLASNARIKIRMCINAFDDDVKKLANNYKIIYK